MNAPKSNLTATSRNLGDGNKKPKRFFHRTVSGRRFSAEAWARVCMGRPPIYPESKALAERCGVTVSHVIRVLSGKRVSGFIMAERERLRAEAPDIFNGPCEETQFGGAA